ncbi:MAG: nicotinamide-nucleotide amidohydrolase family protein, partial [Alphaproteobacteria bacterium]|nr:nicotinamide-nucleotide amidohydrolase family protein [Alphaproteobacteria bacterium]
LLKNKTIAIAESCTGGLISSRLTDVAGSSAYLIGSIIAYSNSVKTQLLNVDETTLNSQGAVSKDVAERMAAEVRSKFGADIGLSATGIMGPGGGTPEKPVGTVWIGISSASQTESRKLVLGIDRLANKRRASTAVLNLLRLKLVATPGI